VRARAEALLRDPRAADRGLAALVAVLSLVAVATHRHVEGPRALNAVAILLYPALLLVRRRAPLASWLAMLAGTVAFTAVLTAAPDLGAPLLALVAGSYTCAAYCEQRPALLGLLAGIVAVPLVNVAWGKGVLSDVIFPIAFLMGAPWLAGRAIRHRSALNAALREKAERLAREGEEEARRAVAAERTRISRELHDVVAHSVSVMVIQASAAGRIVERDPARAAESGALIESTGREALAEVRRLFGAVGLQDADIAFDAQPTLARVEELAEAARVAGLEVELRIEGDPVQLPPGLDLAAYRVVQEALANTIRHAGPARAQLTVGYRGRSLQLEISDDGHGVTDGASAGRGLTGIRERVALYGGELRMGRGRDGGFAVRATIPLP
jgi:signal transduction histidine kinase